MAGVAVLLREDIFENRVEVVSFWKPAKAENEVLRVGAEEEGVAGVEDDELMLDIFFL